jgi:hypothetical protein
MIRKKAEADLVKVKGAAEAAGLRRASFWPI